MTFKKFQWDILIRVALLCLTISAGAYLLVTPGLLIYEVIALPVIIYQVIDFYNFHKQAQKEVEQFVESIQYRDFSRNFNVSQAPVDLKPLRKGFNEINSAFKVISKKKKHSTNTCRKYWNWLIRASYPTKWKQAMWCG
jgi:two-component system nitrogen regulation sensor histidine kinase NtrY